MLKEKLLGHWRLLWAVDRTEGAEPVYPYGPNPAGLIIYLPDGTMAAQIMDPHRPAFASGDRRSGTLEEMKAAYEGYQAYWGRYEIDEERQAVIHKPEGSLFPNWAGQSQVRYVEMQGPDRVILRTQPIMHQGLERVFELAWERIG